MWTISELMNLYEWESKLTSRFENRGDAYLSYLLLACAVAIVLIAVFSRSAWFKALVAAYVLLP